MVVVAVDRFVVMVRKRNKSAVLGGGGWDGADMWSVYSGSWEATVNSVDLAVGLRQGTKALRQRFVDCHRDGSHVSSTQVVR